MAPSSRFYPHETTEALLIEAHSGSLRSIEAGAAFRSIHGRNRGFEIKTLRRQREYWQRDATRDLASGRTREAIHAYDGVNSGALRD